VKFVGGELEGYDVPVELVEVTDHVFSIDRARCWLLVRRDDGVLVFEIFNAP
jgi:hypothetical protein